MDYTNISRVLRDYWKKDGHTGFNFFVELCGDKPSVKYPDYKYMNKELNEKIIDVLMIK
jgi:hypothetical protein